MSTALAVKQATDVNMDDLQRMAKMMVASGYFDASRDATQAIAQMAIKIMAGREMGYGPFASVQGIHVIQGKPSLAANLMAAAVKAHPRYDYRVRKMSNEAVSIEFFEDNQSIGVSEFTAQDAKDAGLSNKDIWKKFPKNLLFARAMSNGVRFYCPDVFSGNAVYVPEELGANVDGEGNYVDVPMRQIDTQTGEIIEAQQVEQPQHRQIEQQPAPAAHRVTTANGAHPSADDILNDKTLPESVLAFVGELRGQERPGAKKASEKQHQYAVGIIDGITGEQTHRQVFKAIFNRDVTGEQPLALDAFKLILKYLSEKKSVKEGDQWVNVENDDYSPDHVNMVKVIHGWAMESRGQMTIDPQTGEMAEADGDRLFA